MSQLTEKILRSGLVDKHTAALMEKYGLLEEGSTEKVNEDALKGATRVQLERLAEDLAVEAERELALKETMLDLNQMRWPATVGVWDLEENTVRRVGALVDRMGRYFFRPQDVTLRELTPGNFLLCGVADADKKTIFEAQELFVGDQVAAIQVSVSE